MKSNILRLFVFFVFSLITYHLSLITSYAAAPGPPNPQPCQNAIETGQLTDNYISNDQGQAPIRQRFDWNNNPALKSLQPGQSVQLTINADFKIDFSKLQALFAIPNSNYLEGQFQNDTHRLDSITDLNTQDFNIYHGAGQKSAPKIMVDELKKNYVNYVYNKPTLPEAANKYTDINGQPPQKTIYDLVQDWGLPNPPDSNATDSQKQAWLDTWGKYWEKIPTAYREFYNGKIEFRVVKNIKVQEMVQKGTLCPFPIRDITFVLPEFSRTISVADQLNKIVVPCAAQSSHEGDKPQDYQCGQGATTSNLNQDKSLLSQTFNFCKNLITNSTKGFANILKKVTKVSFNILNPVKTAYAAQLPCIKLLKNGLHGSAPFCALPADQIGPNDSCTNPYGNIPNQLDQGNKNVVCTFHVTWTGTFTESHESIDKLTPDNFDACFPNGDGTFHCDVTIQIWPVIRVPFLSEIWNNTLYSDQTEPGTSSIQETGRPGIYGAFTPQSISAADNQFLQDLANIQQICNGDPNSQPYKDNDCSNLLNIWGQLGCSPNTTIENFAECLGYSKKIPGEINNAAASDPKERFIGSVQGCTGKTFVKNKALMPIALQQYLGIQNDCKTSH